MKQLLILIVICFAQNSFSQDKITITTKEPTIHSVIDEENTSIPVAKAQYPGGFDAMYDFLRKNYKKPKKEGIKGKIYITFMVEKDGSLTDIKTLRDIGYGTGEEAIRVIKKFPKWIPATQNNEAIKSSFSFPITIE